MSDSGYVDLYIGFVWVIGYANP